jgi:hypothetical protein
MKILFRNKYHNGTITHMNLISGITTSKRHKCMKETSNGLNYTQR